MTVGEPAAFGHLLRRYRLAARLTQEELAERAALSARALSDLERGVRSRPYPHTVQRLADALGLSPQDRALFEVTAVPSSPPPTGERPAGPGQISGHFLGALPSGPLVARDDEMARLQAILDAVAGGMGHLLLLSGELGVGKTRLTQEVMVAARARGFLVGTGCWYQGEPHILGAALLEALDELTSSVPTPAVHAEVQQCHQALLHRLRREGWDVPGSQDDGLDAPQVGPAVAGLLVTLAAHAPVAVLLDDLQWADEATVKLLQALAHGTRGARVLLLMTCRDGHLSDEHPVLAQILHDLNRERLLERISVRRLVPEETAALVAALMGQAPVSEEVAAFIHRRSKGLPRLIDQLVRALGGRLELRREIGAGAMGRVFEATDAKTGTTVAAKLMLSRGGTDLDAVLRFQQEGAVLAALSHPHIVRIYDTFVDEHASCIIMELLDGPSLGQILRDGPLPLARAKALALQVAAAITYAHAQGIVHRDIKPDNIIVLADDRVKVTDFGIARLLQPETSLHTIATTGMRLGTPLYMAPEQIAGQKVDGRTDIYAVGALLYHMVTGRPPFAGSDALAVAVQHLHAKPAPPSALDPTIPAAWDGLILRALAKEPARRFPSARELERAIVALGEVAGAPARTRRRTRWIAAATGLLVVVGGVVALQAQRLTVARPATLSARIDTYLSGRAAQRQFSGTVLVARQGKIVLDKGYSLADLEHHVPNTAQTIYPVAGVSTSLSVLASLRLLDSGLLTWQTPICRYLPHCPASWMPLTVRMVLDGTAHLPHYEWGRAGNTTQQSLLGCQAEPLAGLPGPAITYQNCTALVLGTLLEKVDGAPWDDTLDLSGAGMQHSGRLTDALAGRALAHSYVGSVVNPRTIYNDFFQVYATAADVYAYDRALFTGHLLSRPSLARLFAPGASVDTPDPAIASPRWGYLWMTGRVVGHRATYTVGDVQNFQTVNMYFPQEEAALVVISNDDHNDVEDIAIHTAALLFGTHVVPPRLIVTAAARAMQGTYRRTFQDADRIAAHDPGLNDWVGGTITITIRNGSIHFVAPDTGTVDEYDTATPDGRLTMSGYLPANQNSFCSNEPHEDPPSGSYRWARHGDTLLIMRTTFDPCLDRGAAIPGKWTRVG